MSSSTWLVAWAVLVGVPPLTADVPEDITRTELVTFSLAVAVQGMALVLETVPPKVVNDQAVRAFMVAELTETATAIMAGLETT